ncbi:PIN domain-containing protein [Brucepastera parasyntrophica]|uniref:PIN domain-containing protein n=1 Tax=Brucepastera parasyntrophica TaxID=2880008 RepID=UPI00210D193C|nr:PIN domain-containing protein [Brucepastera parasyntrophica]ULQ60227.1 PIN domain-containing protein [Brucepastera parasyntrophica]
MKVLVDASVWLVAFSKTSRNAQASEITDMLASLMRDLRVIITGQIRQELLSSIPDKTVRDVIRRKMLALENYDPVTEDYELAAELALKSAAAGVQGNPADFLNCAVAVRNNWEIFTCNEDFMQYKKILQVKVFRMKNTAVSAGSRTPSRPQ